ncbi:hypothetical protein [Natronococcus sp. A-GB7]|uniref:hypothetical protein n=1 Tax=Natronococcus sp. A-GB7 TaxID=3037649 RepID=UPI00241DFD51|nr:hypothetical protein [Natronococcus sp. A-GB7]MDG5821549.1 hypothetical protein [Natronococcus sp. A-GB7]
MTKYELMRLSLPTDRLILETLLEGRNLAANIAESVDRSRNYLNQRMALLHDYGLVAKVGPVEGTGLYEITPKGVAALRLIDEYEEGPEFENLVQERAELIEVRPPKVVDEGADES